MNFSPYHNVRADTEEELNKKVDEKLSSGKFEEISRNKVFDDRIARNQWYARLKLKNPTN